MKIQSHTIIYHTYYPENSQRGKVELEITDHDGIKEMILRSQKPIVLNEHELEALLRFLRTGESE